MMTRIKFQRKNLQTAIAAAIATGVVAAPAVNAAGMPMTTETLYALEAMNGSGPTTGLMIQTDSYWKWSTDRNPQAGNTEVTIHAPAGWQFAPVDPPSYTGPAMALVDTAASDKVVFASNCALTEGGGTGIGGDDSIAVFECDSPLAGVDGSLNGTGREDAYKLFGGFALDQVAGSFCVPDATLSLAITIIDDSQFPVTYLDGTDKAGTDLGTVARTAPASALHFTGELLDSDDAGFTTTNIFTTPPFAAFLFRFNTFGGFPSAKVLPIEVDDKDVPTDVAGVSWARSNFQLQRTTAGVKDLGGTTDYTLLPTDELTLNVNDPQQDFSGLASLCAGGALGNNNCTGGADEFVWGGPGSFMATMGPVDLATATPFLINAPAADAVILQYNADGTNMGPQRVLMMNGQVEGSNGDPLGCVVPYAPPGMWEWGANGIVLEAHDIEKTTFDKVTGFTVRKNTVHMTNNCKSEAPYTIYVGNGDPVQNALSCGSLTPPAGLDCTGVIPAASGGQPGNVTILTNRLTKAAVNTGMTARAYIATSPNCVHGSYDELDKARGTARTTIMERDFFGRLDD